ncbi:MAG TPA: DNA polymerase/3'-5' exonuclease PolX [Gemmatimonadales bacterium]|nr:DNA polymerase/3'-5' exonuclease PolX [Gemmatimonadales bacterium]
MIDRRGASRALEQIASLLEFKGENAFRVRAFRAAGRALAAIPKDLQTALADGTVAATRGIGPATLQIIEELARTGHSRMLDALRKEIPPGLVEMSRISGLGAQRIRQVHKLLGIDSLPELEAAARDGRLARLPRFGARTAENILKSIQFLRRAQGLRLRHHAEQEAQALAGALRQLPGISEVWIAGDLRRAMEVIGEVVIVVVSSVPPADLFRTLADLPGVDEFAGRDERQVTLHFAGGSAIQVIATPPVNAGAVLAEATGSAAHLKELESRAKQRGMTLTGAALWRGSVFVPTPNEEALYRQLELAWIPPELREGTGEIALATDDALPELMTDDDLRGFLHCHTGYSDGTSTIRDLANAAQAQGYEWIGITDHSQAAAYAGGLSPAALQRQADEIDALNEELDGIRILKGIEADILKDGRIDYDAGVLDRLDFVIASIHNRFSLDRAAMTARMLAALDDPHVTIIGHPTGRLLLSREPYELDMDAVLARAAERGVAMEINADPHRLDLDWRYLPRARELGTMISIGADAHSVAGIGNMRFGVGSARKGGIGPAQVVNTMSAERFMDFARKA